MLLRSAFILCLVSTTVNAESSSLNLALPGAPGNYQSDKFRAGDLDCSNAIGSATNLEFGVTGIINQGSNVIGDDTDIGVFARITIPLGKRPKARINCDELYQLELKRKRLEIMKLEQELRQLQTLEFEE